MLNIPERALVNRRIPKNKFYEKLQANKKLKEIFTDQIESVFWKAKISKETVNLDPTDGIQEIEIFELHLKQRELSKEALESIDKAIPYPILFHLVYMGESKLVIAFKERNQNNENRFVIHRYYETPWHNDIAVPFSFTHGRNFQDVYENIIRSMMPIEVMLDEDLEEAVARQIEIEKIKKECDKLKAKIRLERQFDRKVQHNMELQRLMMRLVELNKN